MPPVNDDFVNALVLSPSSGGTLQGDNTGATSDGANDPLIVLGFGPQSMWYKIEAVGSTRYLTINTSAPTSGTPIGDSVIGVYYGVTLAGLTQIAFDDDGGAGAYSLLTSITLPSGQDIYIEVTGYSNNEGTFTLTWEIPYCINAIDILNPASTTASIVGGRVKEAYNGYWNSGYAPENQKEAALRFTWSAGSGTYKVSATGRYPNPGIGTFSTSAAWLLITINEKPIIPIYNRNNFSAFDTDETWEQYPGLTGGTYDRTNDYGNTWVPISNGDVVEVFIVSESNTTSPNAFLPFHLEKICFTITDVDSIACTSVFQFPETPLGDQWGSPKGWGGQWLIPDEIYTLLGVTRYNEAVYNPWSINYVDYDMCALEDGTVYVILKDGWMAGAGTPDNEYHYVVVKKYDPGADSWSQVATLNIRAPTLRYNAEAVSCKYDGTYVYLVWWELDVYVASPSQNTWRWHCKRLDPFDDSIIELGTGQAARSDLGLNYYGSVLASSIACVGNGGDIYVCAEELNDNYSFGYESRLFVWRWNGSVWTDLNLPDPTVVGPGGSPPTPNTFDIVGENSYYDQKTTMICARHDEGPVTDGITLAYCYWWNDGTGPAENRTAAVTIPYTVGVGWGTEIRSALGDIELGPPARIGGTFYPDNFDGTWLCMDLMWSPNRAKLVLAVDFYNSSGAGAIWDVLQMNDAGTQWELYETIAPGDVTGTWNQSRNTADIGPDGEVYAARMSTTVDDGGDWFRPKIFKTSPGYLAGYSVAAAPAIGEAALPYPWSAYLGATAHYRIRVVGNNAYLILNLYTEDDDGVGGWGGSYGEGIYVFKLSYIAAISGIISMCWKASKCSGLGG